MNSFSKIKSNYALKKIFNILNDNKKLKIVKYNTRIKNLLNISIKNHKKYSEMQL